MELYVCWGTFQTKKGHPCGDAYDALVAVGHDPEVTRTFGCYGTDPLFPGRRAVRRMTGNYKVPTLVLDDDTVIDGTAGIVSWAQANPA